MKAWFGIFITVVWVLITSCHAQQKAVSNPLVARVADSDEVVHRAQRADSGTVSHRYLATGGGIVIITRHISNGDTLKYLPMQGLTGFDKEGLEIVFNYSPLAIMHQKGCGNAEPVIISNVRKKE